MGVMENRDGSGLLQTFDVSSDSDEVLGMALRIPFKWTKKASHYSVGKSERECDVLNLWVWANEKDAMPLPYLITTPETLHEFVRAWLRSAKRGPTRDTDGDVTKGWRVMQDKLMLLVRVEADWIVYGK